MDLPQITSASQNWQEHSERYSINQNGNYNVFISNFSLWVTIITENGGTDLVVFCSVGKGVASSVGITG